MIVPAATAAMNTKRWICRFSRQIHLFVFLAAVAAGTVIGGPIGDRIGRKYVIWVSILGVAPFTLLLPYANLFWTGVLTVRDRPGAGVGVLGHPRLCAGADSGQGRDGRGPLLRLRLRPGRDRRSGARSTGRRHQHWLRLQGLLVPAADRCARPCSCRMSKASARKRPERSASLAIHREADRIKEGVALRRLFLCLLDRSGRGSCRRSPRTRASW